MDERQLQDPRQYRIKSIRVLQFWFVSLLVAGLFAISIVVFTPIRDYIPSEGTEEMQHKIKEHSLRVAALRDSLDAQMNYATQLRMLMMGHIDSTHIAQEEVEPYQATISTNTRVRVVLRLAPPSRSIMHSQRYPYLEWSTIPEVIPVRTVSTGERYCFKYPISPPYPSGRDTLPAVSMHEVAIMQ